MPFGFVLAPYLCQKFLRPIQKLLIDKHPDCIVGFYLDDIIITGPSPGVVRTCVNHLRSIFDDVALSINYEKSILEPTQSCDWLGFKFDAKNRALRHGEESIFFLERAK